LVQIRQADGGIEFCTTAEEVDIARQLRSHFRLCDNVVAIYNDLSKDSMMAQLVRKFAGLRVMRIDPWECLVFFILTARSDIDRAKQNMERVAAEFRTGPPLDGYNGTRYAFPRPSDLCEGNALERLNRVIVGLSSKGPRIYKAACAAHSGQLDFDTLKDTPYVRDGVRNLDKLLEGVGPKSANCVALFALDKLDGFPIDTRIFKALNRLYGNEPSYPKSKTPTAVGRWNWCQKRFGPYAGYASQFLFRYSQVCL
jgi:N-glycosylase/DNA lyase